LAPSADRSLLKDILSGTAPETPPDLQRMKDLARLNHRVLMECRRVLIPGRTTAEAAAFCRKAVRHLSRNRADAVEIHINVNEYACHCPPDSRQLRDGDIATLDLVLFSQGHYSDGAWTYQIGEGTREDRMLIDAAWNASLAAVTDIRAGGSSATLSRCVGAPLKGSHIQIVPQACGHGIGRELHMDPEIPFTQDNSPPFTWTAGLICTVEPVVTSGSPDLEFLNDKGFRNSTGGRAAYFEHMILIEAEKTSCLNIPEIKNCRSIDIFF